MEGVKYLKQIQLVGHVDLQGSAIPIPSGLGLGRITIVGYRHTGLTKLIDRDI